MKKTIVAGMVLYNPDMERLYKCLDSIFKQFDTLIIFDNSKDCNTNITNNARIIYITEKGNKGLAYALNKIMRKALELGYQWLVTLDQDTLLPNNLLKEYSKFIKYENVAILTGQIIDNRRKYMKLQNKTGVTDVDFCITSASCVNLNIWNDLNGFDEWLFIDFIDNDYCKRVKLKGYRILRINEVIIDQQFGEITPKSPKWVSFYLFLSKMFRNKNIAKLSYKKKVSPMRIYHVHRNLLYLNKKFQKYGGIGYENFNCNSFLGFLLYFSLPSICRAQNHYAVFKSIIKGFRDGKKSIVNTFE